MAQDHQILFERGGGKDGKRECASADLIRSGNVMAMCVCVDIVDLVQVVVRPPRKGNMVVHLAPQENTRTHGANPPP